MKIDTKVNFNNRSIKLIEDKTAFNASFFIKRDVALDYCFLKCTWFYELKWTFRIYKVCLRLVKLKKRS